MKRWIIEYFDILSKCNKTVYFYSYTVETTVENVLAQFRFEYFDNDFVFPIVGIREG